jgi:hypothetical protein
MSTWLLRLCALLLATASSPHVSALRAADHGHGADVLANHISAAFSDDAPLSFVSVYANAPRAPGTVQIRLASKSDKAVAQLWCQMLWDDTACPDLMYVVTAPLSYGASPDATGRTVAPVGPLQTVTLELPATKVGSLLQTAQAKCRGRWRLRLDLIRVRFADGSEWQPSRVSTPSN